MMSLRLIHELRVQLLRDVPGIIYPSVVRHVILFIVKQNMKSLGAKFPVVANGLLQGVMQIIAINFIIDVEARCNKSGPVHQSFMLDQESSTVVD